MKKKKSNQRQHENSLFSDMSQHGLSPSHPTPKKKAVAQDEILNEKMLQNN